MGSVVGLKNKTRGMVEVRMGGRTHTLRFRTHEIAMLEERLGSSITNILSESQLGIRTLREAILVGVAHEYAGKKGKEARLTLAKVGRWIDECEDLGELMSTVMEAVALGIPGSQDDDDDDDEEDGEEKEPDPFVPPKKASKSASTSTSS
jgi:hypothetical protein